MTNAVKDVMTRDAVTVSPETTLRDVAELLSLHHIGGVPVVGSNERVLGVVSASDVLDFLAASPGVPVERPEHVEWGEIGRPVDDPPDAGSSTYFLDLWADAGADVLERFHASGSPEWDTLEEHTADEVMTRRVVSVTPDAPVEDAVWKMLDEGVHRLLVLENGHLLGVVTTRDLLRVLAGV